MREDRPAGDGEGGPSERGINPRRPPGDGGADLHTHTTASDGTLDPAELVRRAADAGLAAVAVTDHDTLEGVPPALEAGSRAGIRVVAGVELSTHWRDGQAEVHILGYGLNRDSPQLAQLLADMRRARRERAAEMLTRLHHLGLPLDPQQVGGPAGGMSIGRPHIARAMIQAGYVTSVADAFNRYLARGRPAFVPGRKISPVRAVEILRGAGGVPVLAHPGLLRIHPVNSGLLAELQEKGLAGLEVYHSRHDGPTCRRMARLARTQGLIPTGGSDCHGPGPGSAPLLGSIRIPTATVDTLMEQVT